MCPDENPPNPEREQTDESLRAEREKADHALGEETAAIDEAADAVIVKARARADEVLATARAKADRETRPPNAPSPAVVERRRATADQVLEGERAEADEALRVERADAVASLSIERRETDKDLSSERAQSDDALATRDDFLAVVSHDLRNMLHLVVGYASLIAQEAQLGGHAEQVVGHARRIERSGARMSRLIGDLVDVASIEAGKLAVTREVSDPRQVVTEAVDAFQGLASSSGLSLVAEIVPPLGPAVFDPARILQVLTNLLSNAIKFTPRNGNVLVRVERIADELHFTVRDTGEGIASEDLEAVFERFRQLVKNDRRGAGLGLYISKCIVQGHGGRIWAESQKGQGSTFHFTLPIPAAA